MRFLEIRIFQKQMCFRNLINYCNILQHVIAQDLSRNIWLSWRMTELRPSGSAALTQPFNYEMIWMQTPQFVKIRFLFYYPIATHYEMTLISTTHFLKMWCQNLSTYRTILQIVMWSKTISPLGVVVPLIYVLPSISKCYCSNAIIR